MYSVKNHRKYAIVAAYDESFKRQYKSRFYYFLNKSDKNSDSSCSHGKTFNQGRPRSTEAIEEDWVEGEYNGGKRKQLR